MMRHVVKSSSIATLGYEATTSVLEVVFHGGRVYRYRDVPEGEFERFLAAPSKGRYYNANIRNQYAYEQVSPEAIDLV